MRHLYCALLKNWMHCFGNYAARSQDVGNLRNVAFLSNDWLTNVRQNKVLDSVYEKARLLFSWLIFESLYTSVRVHKLFF